MAFLLSALRLPQEFLTGLAGSQPREKGAPHAPGASGFAVMLNGQVDALGAGDPVAAATPVAQLTALVESGTPLSAIVERLSGQVADALALLPGMGAGGGADRLRLEHSIKTALSPPANAPPGQLTAEREVAALARRLQQWLANVARAGRAGQQSDTQGKVLDAADAARELPAQPDQPSPPTSATDPSALAQALLAGVAASFETPGSVQQAPARIVESVASTSAKAAARSASSLAKLQGDAAEAAARVRASLDPPAVTQDQPQGQSATPEQPTARFGAFPSPPAPAPPGGSSAESAPVGLLARMLARATSVDARLGALRSVSTSVTALSEAARRGGAPTTHAENADSESNGGSQPAPAMAARAAATLAEAAAASTQGDASQQNQANADTEGSANAPGAAPTRLAASPVPAGFNSALTSLGLGAAQPHFTAPGPASPAAGATVDPSAVVEQIVKGMAMRTTGDGTSEVRLHLVPDQLGAVTIKLSVNGPNVTATAIAQNADVRNALVANQQHLTRSLAESGLKLTSFTVNYSGGDAGQNDRNRDRAAGFGRRYAVHELPAAPADATPGLGSGPDLVPGSMLALFNYLA
jgi:flagellar hook-length control protein FliK